MENEVVVMSEVMQKSLKEDLAQAVKLQDQILSLTEAFNQRCRDADETYPLAKGVFKEHVVNVSKAKLTDLMNKQKDKLESHELLINL